jgi:hypothetical protein
MAMLKREDILSARLRHEDVLVPEWGGEVRVWGISAKRAQEAREGEKDLVVARLVAACLGDESGPFDPPVDADELRTLVTVGTLSRLTSTALALNGLSPDAAEKLRGNSRGEAVGSSPSTSPVNSDTPA